MARVTNGLGNHTTKPDGRTWPMSCAYADRGSRTDAFAAACGRIHVRSRWVATSSLWSPSIIFGTGTLGMSAEALHATRRRVASIAVTLSLGLHVLLSAPGTPGSSVPAPPS
jgi:hypothetical protein